MCVTYMCVAHVCMHHEYFYVFHYSFSVCVCVSRVNLLSEIWQWTNLIGFECNQWGSGYIYSSSKRIPLVWTIQRHTDGQIQLDSKTTWRDLKPRPLVAWARTIGWMWVSLLNMSRHIFTSLSTVFHYKGKKLETPIVRLTDPFCRCWFLFCPLFPL